MNCARRCAQAAMYLQGHAECMHTMLHIYGEHVSVEFCGALGAGDVCTHALRCDFVFQCCCPCWCDLCPSSPHCWREMGQRPMPGKHGIAGADTATPCWMLPRWCLCQQQQDCCLAGPCQRVLPCPT